MKGSGIRGRGIWCGNALNCFPFLVAVVKVKGGS